jgi:hypothetical protein
MHGLGARLKDLSYSFSPIKFRHLGDLLNTLDLICSAIAWNNIYVNRQAAAHTVSPQMSLRDLKEHYEKSLAVFDAIELALELKPRDLRKIT